MYERIKVEKLIQSGRIFIGLDALPLSSSTSAKSILITWKRYVEHDNIFHERL